MSSPDTPSEAMRKAARRLFWEAKRTEAKEQPGAPADPYDAVAFDLGFTLAMCKLEKELAHLRETLQSRIDNNPDLQAAFAMCGPREMFLIGFQTAIGCLNGEYDDGEPLTPGGG